MIPGETNHMHTLWLDLWLYTRFFNIKIYLAALCLSCGTGGLHCLTYDLCCSMRDLVPWPGIEPGPPALGAQSLTHWTTREVPIHTFVKKIHFLLPDIWVFTIPVLQQTLYISLLAHGSSEEKLLGQRTWMSLQLLRNIILSLWKGDMPIWNAVCYVFLI